MIRIRKKYIWCLCAVFILLLSIGISVNVFGRTEPPKMFGGTIIKLNHLEEETSMAMSQKTSDWNERYHRPSKSEPLEIPKDMEEKSEQSTGYSKPDAVVDAYFTILGEAANMVGYSGGCGTVGDALDPYPKAYALLSEGYKKELTYDSFLRSFQGIGHTTYLKRYPASSLLGATDTQRYYMVEIETIQGVKGESSSKDSFYYYYGLVKVEREGEGWKITDIRFYPEDFLCAPYHGWFYDARSVVGIVYKENLKIFDRVDSEKNENGLIYIEGRGKGGRFKLEFVRLTNGYDILLREFRLENWQWVESNLLNEEWSYLKLGQETAQGDKAT